MSQPAYLMRHVPDPPRPEDFREIDGRRVQMRARFHYEQERIPRTDDPEENWLERLRRQLQEVFSR